MSIPNGIKKTGGLLLGDKKLGKQNVLWGEGDANIRHFPVHK
jgi:hypothetical protein